MKIPGSIRRIYEEQEEDYKKLQGFVDVKLKALKDSRWHYESRIKSIDSFCLKLESGRPIDDFFACTIVVANATEIEKAKELVEHVFHARSQRPDNFNFTHKHSDSFPFDDLRLYVNLKEDTALPLTGLEKLQFEIQLKTFLQHAWVIATHDLVYKTDDVNWSKERIAYQIKAMLEHAELSIFEAETIAQSKALAKTNRRTKDIREIISTLKLHWSESDLPSNLRRLAENILTLLTALEIKISDIDSILNQEKTESNGVLPLNLSPYGVLVQGILKQRQNTIIPFLTGSKDKRKILIPAEIALPPGISEIACANGIFVGERPA
jgi:ppGpp synthetase/RelA/SpoT-type nucleotidyltranferase